MAFEYTKPLCFDEPQCSNAGHNSVMAETKLSMTWANVADLFLSATAIECSSKAGDNDASDCNNLAYSHFSFGKLPHP